MDLKITELPVLQGTDLEGGDPLALADRSASETRRITTKEYLENGLARVIDDGTIPGAKLVPDSVTSKEIGPDAVTDSELADNAVDTAAIQDGAVTDPKVAYGINGAKLQNDTVTASKIPASSLDRGLDKTSGAIGHTNTVSPAKMSGITFDAQGHIYEAVRLVSSDLPPATTTEIGAVSIPTDSGLTVTAAGVVDHENNIGAGTRSGITYDDHGHISATRALIGSDLPIATDREIGGVAVPGPVLEISGSGSITHRDTSVAPGDYPKVTVDRQGHVTAGLALTPADVPNLDASKINTGTFDPARIADRSLTNAKFGDYSTVLIQETEPAGFDYYTGQMWYRESDAQLRTWSGNSWIPVGFGRLSQENLRFCGTFDANTGLIDQVTAFGASAGMTAGAAVPAATDALTGAYLVATTPGTFNSQTYDNGDWTLCLGQAQGWERVDTLNGAGTTTIKLEDLLDTTITAPASGDTLIFDAVTGKWVNKPTAAQKASFVEAIDGVRTSYTLTRDAGSVNNLLISIGGIIQEPGVDFTFTAPRTVNFAAPPPAGIDYWVLIEGVASTGGGGGGTSLPDGTAAEEFLGWVAASSSWQPKTVLEGGTF